MVLAHHNEITITLPLFPIGGVKHILNIITDLSYLAEDWILYESDPRPDGFSANTYFII
jgi:hypothetical protein